MDGSARRQLSLDWFGADRTAHDRGHGLPAGRGREPWSGPAGGRRPRGPWWRAVAATGSPSSPSGWPCWRSPSPAGGSSPAATAGAEPRSCCRWGRHGRHRGRGARRGAGGSERTVTDLHAAVMVFACAGLCAVTHAPGSGARRHGARHPRGPWRGAWPRPRCPAVSIALPRVTAPG